MHTKLMGHTRIPWQLPVQDPARTAMNLQQLLARLPWSRSRNHPPPTSEVPEPAVASAESSPLKVDRLDLQTAIIHHLEWCVLFNEHLSVDAANARHVTPLPDAQQSALGQWITHMGQRTVGEHPRFIELQQEHLRFHELADQALDHARNQRMDLASNLLNSEFERSRARVLDMLRSLQKT